MKKNLVLLLLVFCTAQKTWAQADSSFFEVIKPEGEFHHSLINGHNYTKKRSAGYWDDQLIVEGSFSSPILVNQKIYITQGVDDDSYEIFELDVTGKLNSKGKLTADHIFQTTYDLFVRSNDQLLVINPETMTSELVFDYTALVRKDSRYSLQSINTISENELALIFGMDEMGCYDFDTYIINKKTGKLIYNNQHKGKENWTNASKFCPFLKDEEKREYYVYRSDGPDKEGRYYMFNEDFSVRRPILGGRETIPFQCTLCEYGTYTAGIRVENNQLKYVYLGVDYFEGYDKTTYFLPYKFDSQLWHLTDQIFNNQRLHKSDLQKLNFYQLSILKNAVFARHNYQFDSDFYKAYFSLFTFYANSEAGKARTKNVNDLLTGNDQSNLTLIFSAIENLN